MSVKDLPPVGQKTLRRSRINKTVLGVCGGLGEYFDIDPVLVRVIWVLLSILSGFFPGLIAYILIALVMPEGK